MGQDVLDSIACDRILSSLEFEEMHGRYEAVPEAHDQTFKWIFNMDSPEASEFLDWLLSGQGIFHISAKLGCGKSTLMKHLFDEPRTKAELEKWAGEFGILLVDDLIGVSYMFK